MKPVLVVTCCLGLGISLAACTTGSRPLAFSQLSVPQISAAELLARIQSGKDVPFLLDVRHPEELKGELGQLPGIVNIPQAQLFTRLDEIPKDRDVVVINSNGNRSLLAETQMRKQGYKRLYNLEGGMLAIKALQAKPAAPASGQTQDGNNHAR